MKRDDTCRTVRCRVCCSMHICGCAQNDDQRSAKSYTANTIRCSNYKDSRDTDHSAAKQNTCHKAR